MLAWEIIGGALGVGLVVAVASPFVVDWIRAGVRAQGMEGFWIPTVLVLLASLAVITAVFLATASLISPKWRDRVWKRSAEWLWSWRPVSYRRHHRELFQQNEAILGEVGSIAEATSKNDAAIRGTSLWAQEAIEKVRLSIPDLTLQLLTQIAENKKAIEELRKDFEETRSLSLGSLTIDPGANVAAAESQSSLAADPETQKRRPLAPRWRLAFESGDKMFDHTYTLKNLVPGSFAQRVRFENVHETPGAFEFKDAAAWADLSGENEVTFMGEIISTNSENIFRLQLGWYDDNDQWHSRTFSLNGPYQWDPPGRESGDTSF